MASENSFPEPIANRSVQYQYDAVDELTRATYPSNPTQNYTYDHTQNRTALNQSGVDTSYTINALNQVTRFTSGSAIANLAYDSNGNLAQMSNAGGATNYTHDIFNRLVTVDEAGADAAKYEYYYAGRRTRKTVNGTSEFYTWDGNQLVEVRNSSGAVTKRFIYGVGIDEPLVIFVG